MKERKDERLPRTLRSRMRSLVMVVLIAALMPTALVGWNELYSAHLELSAPVIEVLETPRGIGLTPVRVIFRVQDLASGIDQVDTEFVSANGSSRTLLSRALKGKMSERFTLEFSGDSSELEEGPGVLRIHASDDSLWGNSANFELALGVDFHKPTLKFVSKSPIAREGRTSFAMYEAVDRDLALSGIKVGNRVFQGFPARGFDAEIVDPNLYGVFYSVEGAQSNIKLFAEDQVGNTEGIDLQIVTERAKTPTFNREVSSDDLVRLVQNLVDKELSRFEQLAAGASALLSTEGKDIESRTADRFRFLVEYRLALDNQAILAELTRMQRFERYWEDFFSRPSGAMVANFGSIITFTNGAKTLARLTTPWIEIAPSGADGPVRALNEGVVTFVGELGLYGNLVVIDHGLGVTSLYGGLGSPMVQPGERVHRNQILASSQGRGLLEPGNYLLEMRVQGVRVDPSEWWNGSWYQSEFIDQIDAIRRSKGLPIYRPLNN